MPPAGLEPTAPGLGILCSIQLSYGGAPSFFILFAKRLQDSPQRVFSSPLTSWRQALRHLTNYLRFF